MKGRVIFFSIFIAHFCAAQNAPLFIDQGTVNDNVTITFTGSGKTLQKGQTFSLRELGIQYANYTPERPDNLFYVRTNCQTGGGDLLGAYRDSRVKSYDIEITSPNRNKKFYGKIAFFAAMPDAAGQAVTRDYLISIPQEYFDRGSNGQTADVYEYYHTEGYDYVTWVIWLSDVPFPSFNRTEFLQQVNTRPTPSVPSYKKTLRSGIAQTVFGAIFLPVGAALMAAGSRNIMNSNAASNVDSIYYGPGPGAFISELTIGGSMLVIGTVLIINGPIKISRAMKLKRQGNPKIQPSKEPMELCVNPVYNPVKGGNYGVGFNLKF